MSKDIKHAPWWTPSSLMHTAAWDQATWDCYAEQYRPKGYTGDIYDQRAYLTWSAELHIAHAPLKDIEQHERVGLMCRCGNCFCCAVMQARQDKIVPVPPRGEREP